MKIVIIGRETAHGKKYWNTCSEGDVVCPADTFKVSEGFEVAEDATKECIEESFRNAYGVSVEAWLLQIG